jgi:hypothetical protein
MALTNELIYAIEAASSKIIIILFGLNLYYKLIRWVYK